MRIRYLFGGCAVVMVLMIGSCAGLLYYGYQTTSAVAGPKIDALLAAIEDQTFPETYNSETTAALRSVTSQEAYAQLGEAIRLRLGPLRRKSLTAFKSQHKTNGTWIEVTYDAHFKNGPGTIFAVLKREGEAWRFEQFNVTSPVFQSDLAAFECPSCGAPHAADARFCPACGKAIPAAPPAENQPPDGPQGEPSVPLA